MKESSTCYSSEVIKGCAHCALVIELAMQLAYGLFFMYEFRTVIVLVIIN